MVLSSNVKGRGKNRVAVTIDDPVFSWVSLSRSQKSYEPRETARLRPMRVRFEATHEAELRINNLQMILMSRAVFLESDVPRNKWRFANVLLLDKISI